MSRGKDGTVGVPRIYPTMQCVVIGGVAHGVVLPNLSTEAETIALQRPIYIKPLAYSKQEMPEVEKESSTYNINIFYLPDDEGNTVPFGLAIVEDQSPVWAMSRLVEGFARHHLNQLAAENLKT